MHQADRGQFPLEDPLFYIYKYDASDYDGLVVGNALFARKVSNCIY